MLEGPPVNGRWDLEPVAVGTRLTMTPTVRLPGSKRHPSRWRPSPRLAFASFHGWLKRVLEAA
jgi:hypothetical protein